MASPVFQLESLLEDALKGKGFQNIEKFLQDQRDVQPYQKCSKELLNRIDKLVNKEMDKNEFKNVSCLLRCIQYLGKNDSDDGFPVLIEHGLVTKISKKQLLDSFLLRLGLAVVDKECSFSFRLEAIRTVNSMLDDPSREDRRKFHLSEELCVLMQDFARTILDVGDYEIQVAISETLCRMTIKKWRHELADKWFGDEYLAKAFKQIQDKEFETDCRKFLNELNSRLGDKRRVYTYPCISAFIDMDEVKKPNDDKVDVFWIDFNLGSQSVTFFTDDLEGILWDSVILAKDNVNHFSVEEVDEQIILSVYMRVPLMINKREGTKVRIHFEPKFDILSMTKMVFGENKQLSHLSSLYSEYKNVVPETQQSNQDKTEVNFSASDGELSKTHDSGEMFKEQRCHSDPEGSHGKSSRRKSGHRISLIESSSAKDQSKKVQSVSGIKTPSAAEHLKESGTDETGSISDILTSQCSDPSLLNRSSGATSKDQEQQSQNIDAEGGEKILMNLEVHLTRRIINRSQTPKRTRERLLSNEQGAPKGGYKKHLFSESNYEHNSTEQSEKSWISESKKKATPKSSSYSRSKPRIKSRLKVLPVSSESNVDEDTKEMIMSEKRSKTKLLTKTLTVSLEGLPGISAFVTPGTESPYRKARVEQPLLNEEVMDEQFGASPEYEERTLMKKVSDLASLDQTNKFTRNVKFSKSQPDNTEQASKKSKVIPDEMDSATPELSFRPRKLFGSSEKSLNVEEKESANLSESPFTESDKEFDDNSLIESFENFSKELKKKFWKEQVPVPGQFDWWNLFTKSVCIPKIMADSPPRCSLLEELNDCSLRHMKLEKFQKVVVEELASLDKDSQTLMELEEETMNFWKNQSLKLNSFCEQQEERLKKQEKYGVLTSKLDDSAAAALNVYYKREAT
nr:PREDICTED: synaptonemal complex protein 2-like [Latimeria chalumnae]|eukprot:XP_014350294.1 PREDICTED: synaptonemal complex protein 2-like [Latimeria chalumnae]